ncbi:hypothetical protein O3P69_011582 [Scylla paramamosain]|uniref:Uncharacterized protein n=1 Tax=Scylla paramamosain TaxID=85552 RepID=A0AAW0T6B7_SCYPA
MNRHSWTVIELCTRGRGSSVDHQTQCAWGSGADTRTCGQWADWGADTLAGALDPCCWGGGSCQTGCVRSDSSLACPPRKDVTMTAPGTPHLPVT